MPHISQLNYEETSSLSKELHDDGDDLVLLHSKTRQRLDALRDEWQGESAEAFFEEMEGELLPALQRVSGALFFSVDILNKIMKIIHEADDETAGYFKNDLMGGGLLGLGGGLLGGILGGRSASVDDFGAGNFEAALDPSAADGAVPATGPGSEAGPPPLTYMDMQPPSSEAATPVTAPTETPQAETAGGGGGGGGGESSQGLQGDLKGLGTGVGGGGQPAGPAGAGTGPQAMPDHVFEGSSAGDSPGAGTSPSGPAGGNVGSPPGPSTGGLAGAAGVAGVAGAAAAGAAKILKSEENESGE